MRRFGPWAPALAALLTLTACEPEEAPLPAGHTLFVGRVFDGREAFEGSVEIDASGTIVDVRRVRRSGVEGAIELGDGTLLPGLIDLHTHVTASGGIIRTAPIDDHEPALKAMLRSGVTSTLHLGGLARASFEVRRRARDGELVVTPRLFSVGPFLDPPGSSHCVSGAQQLDHCVALPSPEAARAAVANLERIYGPDAIKITHDSGIPERPSNPFDDATLRALVDAAGSTPLVAHIRNVRDIDSAVAAGVGTITHLPLDERFSPEQAGTWVSAGVRFIPTIGLSRREHALVTGQIDLDDPTLAHDVPAGALADVRGIAYAPSAAARTEEVRENVHHNFRSLLAAGATILAGSDSGVTGVFHGLALADELVEMVTQGMAPEAALQGATRDAADFLDRPDLGRIEVGATADLLVVDGDPLDDMSALRAVRRVYLAGVEVDREALEVDRDLPLERDPARAVSGDSPCLRTSECAATETCTRLYRCAPRCDDSTDCGAGTFCGPDIADGRGCYPSIGCDLVAQNCSNGTACVPMANGATWCASGGTARPGDPCDGTSFATVCEPGARCAAGTCEALCALGGGACPAGSVCESLEPETGVAIGACR